MAEPTTAAGVTYAATGVVVPVIVAFGVPLGLRADVLVAGFLGSVAAIGLLDTVPSSGDTWIELMRTTFKRMFVAISSAFTAGYLTPMVLLMANLSEPAFLAASFAIGGGAQQVLRWAIARIQVEKS